MSLLPIVLFVLGLIFLIWALKVGNSYGATSPEMMTALKGLANVKRELSQLQKGLREAHAQLGDHELRLFRNENAQAEIRSTLQANSVNADLNPNSNLNVNYSSNNSDSYLNSGYNQNTVQSAPKPSTQFLSQVKNSTQASVRKPQVLPEKYRWVIELHDQGWSVAEIAGHLAISQDAVNMVLRTFQRGGCA